MISPGSPPGLAGNGFLGIPAVGGLPSLGVLTVATGGLFLPSYLSYKTISWREPRVNKSTAHAMSSIVIEKGEDFCYLQK